MSTVITSYFFQFQLTPLCLIGSAMVILASAMYSMKKFPARCLRLVIFLPLLLSVVILSQDERHVLRRMSVVNVTENTVLKGALAVARVGVELPRVHGTARVSLPSLPTPVAGQEVPVEAAGAVGFRVAGPVEKRVAIGGASGYIGSELFRHLHQFAFHVVGFDRDPKLVFPPGMTMKHLSSDAIPSAELEGFDTVVFLGKYVVPVLHVLGFLFAHRVCSQLCRWLYRSSSL
jgi:hypothetical protein